MRNKNSIHRELLEDKNFSFNKSKIKEEFINYFKKIFNNGEEHLFNEGEIRNLI